MPRHVRSRALPGCLPYELASYDRALARAEMVMALTSRREESAARGALGNACVQAVNARLNCVHLPGLSSIPDRRLGLKRMHAPEHAHGGWHVSTC